MCLSFVGADGSLKPIISAVSWTVFSRLWCLSVSSRHMRCDRMYCKYVSATHNISSGPRQYWAGVTWFDRYSDSINRIRGRSSNLPPDATYRNSRVSDRRRPSEVFPNISNAFGESCLLYTKVDYIRFPFKITIKKFKILKKHLQYPMAPRRIVIIYLLIS